MSNTNQFINLHRSKSIKNYSFSLVKENINQSVGIFNLSQIEKEFFKSPITGSFGSFEFIDDLNAEIKIKFIEEVLKLIEEKLNPKKIEIVLSPDIYDLENNSIIFLTLRNNNFNISRLEINQFIDLNYHNFQNNVSYGNKKRIKNCIKAGIEFQILEESKYIDGFKVIENNRKRRGFPLTMNWKSMDSMIKEFKDQIYFFGLIHNDMIIASAICLKVKSNILYVFYWGEIEGFEKLSPIAFLSQKLIVYAKEKKFRLLDIGTSSFNSNPNIGLLKFKKSIGCVSCNKLYLTKSY